MKKVFGRWVDDEGAQATVEYILMLATVVFMFTLIYKKLLKPTFARMGPVLERNLQRSLGGPGFHRFPIRK
jgi:hypothetical protein